MDYFKAVWQYIYQHLVVAYLVILLSYAGLYLLLLNSVSSFYYADLVLYLYGAIILLVFVQPLLVLLHKLLSYRQINIILLVIFAAAITADLSQYLASGLLPFTQNCLNSVTASTSCSTATYWLPVSFPAGALLLAGLSLRLVPGFSKNYQEDVFK